MNHHFSVVESGTVALIASRRRYRELDRRFTVLFVLWIPTLVVSANTVSVLNLGVTALITGLIAEAVGVIALFACVRGEPTAFIP